MDFVKVKSIPKLDNSCSSKTNTPNVKELFDVRGPEHEVEKEKRKEETNIVGSWTIYGGLSGVCTRATMAAPK